MKRVKLIFLVTMSMIFTFMCFVNSTFSWFDRPMEKKGSKFTWTQNEYAVSTGNNVSIVTYASSDGGDTYGTTPITSVSGTLSSGEKKCFRTDITNLGDINQSVSLFLSGMTSSNNFDTYLGVNGPMRTHKPFASQSETSYSVLSDVYQKNVYMGLHKDEISDLSSKSPGVHYWDYDGLVGDVVWGNRINTNRTGSWSVGSGYWGNNSQTFNIYAMKIDSRATNMQLKYGNDSSSGVDIANSENNTLVFFEYGNNYFVQEKKSGAGAQIDTFYSRATVDKGKSISLPAVGGGTITYSSSNTSVATVDSTGTVTGVKAGTATITATSKGAYGDAIASSCTVTVRDTASASDTIDNVPVVTNFLVEKTVDEEKPSVQSVYWYIRNESYANVTFSFNEVSLTL